MNTAESAMPLLSYHVLSTKEGLLYVANEVNAIIRVDKHTGEKRILGKIPEESVLERCLVSRIFQCKNKIIFVPMNAAKIWIYYPEDDAWEGVALRNASTMRKFSQAVLYKDKLYLINYGYPGFVCMDLSTNSLQCICGIAEELEEISQGKKERYFWKGHVQRGTKLYIPSYKSDHLLELDMETQAFRWIAIEADISGYSGIVWDGKTFWLSSKSGGVLVLWDGEHVIEKKPFALPQNSDPTIRQIVMEKNRLLFLYNNKTTVCDIDDLDHPMPNHEDYFYAIDHTKWSYQGFYTEKNLSGPDVSWDMRIDKNRLIDFLRFQIMNENREKVPFRTALCEGEPLELDSFLQLVKVLKAGSFQACQSNVGMAIWKCLNHQ